MRLILDLCDRLSVLQYGELIAHGDAATVAQDERVREAYLGHELHPLEPSGSGSRRDGCSNSPASKLATISCRCCGGLSSHVEEGEFVALLGPNGAGKTTTLRTIAGFVTPLRGSDHVPRTSPSTACSRTR